MTKYAVEISLITVGIVGVGFISEAVLCVEYIQGTRLALIKADSEIAAVFALFSIMKRKFKYKTSVNNSNTTVDEHLIESTPKFGKRFSY